MLPIPRRKRLFFKEKNQISPEDDPNSSPDVSIPGVNKLFNPYYNIFGKIFWSIAIISSISVCAYQIVNRVRLYISEPLGINVNVTRFPFLPFPAVTICPFYPFRFDAEISQLKRQYAELHNISASTPEELRQKVSHFKILDLPGMTSEHLWNMASMRNKINSTLKLCEFNNEKNCGAGIIVNYIKVFLGICAVLTLNTSIHYDGTYNGMEIHLNNYDSDEDMYWKYAVNLHEVFDIPKHRLFFGIGQMVHPFRETGITVSMKHFQHIENSNAHPCQSREDYQRCLKHCIEPKILQVDVSCRLPYIDDSTLPLCNDSASAEKFYTHTVHVYKELHITCSYCLRKCRQDVYTMVQDVIMRKNMTQVKVVFPDNVVETVEETAFYTIESLLSDIGGNLGLFLGFCLLTILQILEAFALAIINHFKNLCKPKRTEFRKHVGVNIVERPVTFPRSEIS